MIQYQKKAARVDAHQWDPSQPDDVLPDWAKKAIVVGNIYFLNRDSEDAASLKVVLHSGRIGSAYKGDWIVHEPHNGLIYPVEGKTFEKLYEPAPKDEEAFV